MGELHAAIAAYLWSQRRLVASDEVDLTSNIAQSARLSEAAILNIWLARCDVPHCRYCGKAITAGDDAFDVEQMRAARACVNHFAPF